jgi:hypothetical protein
MSDGRQARRHVVARMLVIQGALLIVVAIIHLVMTPEIGQIVAHNTSPQAYAFLWPFVALDHIVVGVLLFPVGLAAIVCAPGIRAGDRRAWWIAIINGLAVLSLPFVLFFTMSPRYFIDAPAFLIAAIIITLVGLWMVWPLLWARREIFTAG